MTSAWLRRRASECAIVAVYRPIEIVKDALGVDASRRRRLDAEQWRALIDGQAGSGQRANGRGVLR